MRAYAALVGCDIHPINNRRVLEYLRKTLGCDDAAVQAWCRTWISAGFDALETMLAADPGRGKFCFGDAPTLADVYLIPQVESARRFKVDLSGYPPVSYTHLDVYKRQLMLRPGETLALPTRSTAMVFHQIEGAADVKVDGHCFSLNEADTCLSLIHI